GQVSPTSAMQITDTCVVPFVSPAMASRSRIVVARPGSRPFALAGRIGTQTFVAAGLSLPTSRFVMRLGVDGSVHALIGELPAFALSGTPKSDVKIGPLVKVSFVPVLPSLMLNVPVVVSWHGESHVAPAGRSWLCQTKVNFLTPEPAGRDATSGHEYVVMPV